MMYEPKKPEESSFYNEAVNQLRRLNDIWNACHSFRIRGMLSQWNIKLDSAWSELSSEKKLTHEEDVTKFRNFSKLITKYKDKKNILYQLIHEKEIFLKALQNRQGKGTKLKEDDEGL